MKRILSLLAVLALVTVGTAHAQIPVSKTGTGVAGLTTAAYNTVDSVIFDGEVVMIDTTSVIKRFGVRRWLGLALDRPRVLGLAVGNIPKSSQGGVGTVLIYGYHPRAHAAKALAAGTPLRLGLINASLATANDSLSMAVGRVLRGVAGATNKDNARYGIFWWGIGGTRTITSL